VIRTVLLLAVLTIGCSDREKPAVQKEPEKSRRVVEPQSRGVRALPPHAISAEGVGPYKLGATVGELLDQLPSGPRIRQFTIPGIVHRDMLRGEDDAILIGTEPQGRAQFVAVVRGEIAKTEANVQVGSTREELDKALGAPLDDLERARDPHIVIPSKLDNAHVVVGGDRIEAIVLTPVVERAKEAPTATEPACTRPTADREKRIFGACLTATGEQIRIGEDEVAVLAKDGEKVAASVRVPGLVFAAALRNPIDGRDELVVVTRSDDGQARTWVLTVYRLVDGKLKWGEPKPVYQITSANARWIGAELDQVDLLLELTSKADAIEVGGLLTTRIADKIRDIVVISPVTVARRVAKGPAPEAPDAGLSDGGTTGSAQGSANSERPGR
jgi:hypothetical protein